MTRRYLSFILVPVAGLAAYAVHASQQAHIQRPRVVLTPFNSTDIYAIGDKVGWTVSVPEEAPPVGACTYTIKRNNLQVIKTGQLDLSSGKATVETTLDGPAMVYIRIDPWMDPSQPTNIPMAPPIAVAGAAVAPTKLEPSIPRPKDFDAFWKAKIKELMAIPANPVLTPGESDRPDVEFSTIQMDHVGGHHVYGQFAKPKREGKFPAVLVLQWASPPYPLQKPWVTNLAAQGYIALNIEPHDVLPNAPQDYYNALPQAIKNYNSIGWDDRDKSYFVQMYLADYRAVEYLASRPDWDGKTLIVTGTSMGGQQSLCVAGLNPKITHVIVEEPSGCDMNAALHGRQEGYPNFPSDNPKIMETAQYVDVVNFASRIKATCLVAMGFVDTVAPPAGIWTAFNQIRGPKEAVPLIEAPHNNTATHAQQLAYFDESGAWFAALAKGERVHLLTDHS